jgi:hypothetical protein
MRAGSICCLLILTVLTLPACARRNYLNENDALRAKVLEQQKQIDDLKRRDEEMRIELQQSTAAPGEVSDEVRQATPHPVSLTIGRLSHVRRVETAPDTLLVYLNPVDGRGRFTQLVGTIQINAYLVPMDAEPATIGQLTATPLQVRDAYRHTPMSTHYSFEVPLTLPVSTELDGTRDSIFVKVLFTDGYTGQTLASDQSVALK